MNLRKITISILIMTGLWLFAAETVDHQINYRIIPTVNNDPVAVQNKTNTFAGINYTNGMTWTPAIFYGTNAFVCNCGGTNYYLLITP